MELKGRWSEDTRERRHMHMVCIGHLDHGKSSILGRMFYDTGSIADTEMERIRTMAKELGREGFEFAFVMDQIKEERSRGITIGLAHKKLLTEKTSFTFADAPGHKDFVKNMLTGASESDGAILVVASDEGIQNQTEQHLYLSKMLGVPKLVVVVNKMDKFDFKEERFQEVKSDIEKLLKKVGYNPGEIPIIPCSALEGDNVVNRSERMEWYKGASLIEIIENLPERKPPTDLPLRLPVQDVYEIEGRPVVIGRISSGKIKTGESVILMPLGKDFGVENIFIQNKEVGEAEPLDNVYLYLKGLDKGEVKRGDIIGKQESKPTIASRFRAQIIVLNQNDVKPGTGALFEMQTESVPCKIIKIEKRVDTRSGEYLEQDLDKITDGECGIVEIETEKPIYIESQEIPQLSNFRLVEDEKRIAMGICVEVCS